jgi:RNA polymerase sigma-70 factor (ECF subfamily)
VVLTTLYLLFSEGYYSESHSDIIRKDLCLEAMRLTYLLIDNSLTNLPAVNALMSLMCFHASRFEARKNEYGQMILYQDQDESLWNQELISKGAQYLKIASQGEQVSKYHLEASIAYWHTIKSDPKEKWENILLLYDHLTKIDHSPVVALNRIYALSKVKGKLTAIAEAGELNQVSSQYYFALLGDLYAGIDNAEAKRNFQKAHDLAKTVTDRDLINNKLLNLTKK